MKLSNANDHVHVRKEEDRNWRKRGAEVPNEKEEIETTSIPKDIREKEKVIEKKTALKEDSSDEQTSSISSESEQEGEMPEYTEDDITYFNSAFCIQPGEQILTKEIVQKSQSKKEWPWHVGEDPRDKQGAGTMLQESPAVNTANPVEEKNPHKITLIEPRQRSEEERKYPPGLTRQDIIKEIMLGDDEYNKNEEECQPSTSGEKTFISAHAAISSCHLNEQPADDGIKELQGEKMVPKRRIRLKGPRFKKKGGDFAFLEFRRVLDTKQRKNHKCFHEDLGFCEEKEVIGTHVYGLEVENVQWRGIHKMNNLGPNYRPE